MLYIPSFFFPPLHSLSVFLSESRKRYLVIDTYEKSEKTARLGRYRFPSDFPHILASTTAWFVGRIVSALLTAAPTSSGPRVSRLTSGSNHRGSLRSAFLLPPRDLFSALRSFCCPRFFFFVRPFFTRIFLPYSWIGNGSSHLYLRPVLSLIVIVIRVQKRKKMKSDELARYLPNNDAKSNSYFIADCWV